MRSCPVFCLGVLLAVAPMLAAAQTLENDPHSWLERMATSVRTLDYDGIFVQLHNTQLESMRVVHVVEEGHERERLVSLNGAAREILRDNKSVTCIWPDTQSVYVNKRRPKTGFPKVLPMDLDSLKPHYEFELLGGDRVADREVAVISIMPRDVYRYGYRLALDTEHALPLKSDLIDETGQPVEQVMFTLLRVGESVDRSQLVPSISGRGFSWVDRTDETEEGEEGAMTESPWKLLSPPAGFRLSARELRRSGQGVVEHLVFTDGLASLSVYAERAGNGAGLRGGSRMGAISAYGALVEDFQVTAVGEVPPATARAFVEAISYSPRTP